MASPAKISLRRLTTRTRHISEPRDSGCLPPASTVAYVAALSALSAGVITRNTSLFTPLVAAAGPEKRHRDWKKWGHGHSNITKSLEEIGRYLLLSGGL